MITGKTNNVSCISLCPYIPFLSNVPSRGSGDNQIPFHSPLRTTLPTVGSSGRSLTRNALALAPDFVPSLTRQPNRPRSCQWQQVKDLRDKQEAPQLLASYLTTVKYGCTPCVQLSSLADILTLRRADIRFGGPEDHSQTWATHSPRFPGLYF